MENDELLHKWVNGTISEEELALFRQRPEYESLVQLYRNTDHLSAPEFDGEAMLQDILSQQKAAPSAPAKGKRMFLSTWMKYGIAATVLLIAGWFLWSYSNQLVQYELAKGERMEGQLPDQSVFILNAGSSLAYSKKAWKTDRSLQLEGEAFFDVKKGSAFTVQTPDGNVQVLGTRFNVWSRQGMLEVQCHSGNVAVLSTDGKMIETLASNEALRLQAGAVTDKWPIPATEKVGWVEGISRFKKVPLSIVLDELERQYQVLIIAEEVNTNTVLSCNFQHQDLELALKTVVGPLGITYEIREKRKVYLYPQ